MRREIVSFHRDELDDWVAMLACAHQQHVRHMPPFTLRPWTQTAAGRASMVGQTLECAACERMELPERVSHYRSTPVFDETSVPKGLLRDHQTKRGVWGQIRVLHGELEYCVTTPFAHRQRITPETRGIIAPETLHYVTPLGAVSFCVEFLKVADD